MVRRIATLCLALLAPLTAVAAEPARVVIVGTYHFSNPGNDLHNVESVDVATPERQAEIQAAVDALARFEPTVVAVERAAAAADEQYTRYLDGRLPTSRSEVVQIGYRLARQRGLPRVHGIDVPGDFPFGPVHAWAGANGRAGELATMQQEVEAMVSRVGVLQSAHPIGTVLHAMNAPDAIDHGHGFYARLLRFGDGDAQPGADLNAAWAARNLAICARLLQSLEPGDRAVVVYGQGHAYLLRRCIEETPGVELVEAQDYLPAPASGEALRIY